MAACTSLEEVRKSMCVCVSCVCVCELTYLSVCFNMEFQATSKCVSVFCFSVTWTVSVRPRLLHPHPLYSPVFSFLLVP